MAYTLNELYDFVKVFSGQSVLTPACADMEILFKMSFGKLCSYCNLDFILPYDLACYPDEFLSLVSELTAYNMLNRGYQNVTSERLGSYSITFESNDETVNNILKRAQKFRRIKGYAPTLDDAFV